MKQVSNETCEDFIYFRRLLLEARKFDDNINHRVNNMKGSEQECMALRLEMESLFQTRLFNIKKCLDYYKNTNSKQSDVEFIHKKEIDLLESELMVEEILQTRGREVLFKKCRPMKE